MNVSPAGKVNPSVSISYTVEGVTEAVTSTPTAALADGTFVGDHWPPSRAILNWLFAKSTLTTVPSNAGALCCSNSETCVASKLPSDNTFTIAFTVCPRARHVKFFAAHVACKSSRNVYFVFESVLTKNTGGVVALTGIGKPSPGCNVKFGEATLVIVPTRRCW